MNEHLKKITPHNDGRHRRIHLTKLNNVSILPGGRGANPGANMTFTKSAKDQEVQKAMGDIVDLATSDTNGHQHGISVSFRNGELCMYTTFASGENDHSHDHALIRNDNGSYSVLANAGHTHDDITADQILSAVSRTMLEKTARGESVVELTQIETSLKQAITKMESVMPDDVKKTEIDAANEAVKNAEKKVDDLTKMVENLTAVAGLSAAHKSHYDGLDEAGKESFLKSDNDARDAAIKAAELEAIKGSDDPIVFKTSSGMVFRKSDDPRMIQMAKEREAEQAEVAKERERTNDLLKEAADSKIEALAKELMGNQPGDLDTHKAMVSAISSIGDETIRKAAFETLRAKNEIFKRAFGNIGTAEGDSEMPAKKAAASSLDKMAKERASKDNISFYDAYAKVSAENPELRRQSRAEPNRV